MISITISFYTAFGIYQSLHLQNNDRVLIRATTSGVGVAILKLMKASGLNLTVAGTTRSNQKDQALQDLGLDQIIHTPDANQLPESSGSFDKIIDLVGPSALRDSLSHLAEFGIVSATGKLGGVWTLDDFDPVADIPNNRYLTGFSSASVDEKHVDDLFNFIVEHQVAVRPEAVFSLPDVRKAHEYLEGKNSLGKVVVLPWGDR